MSANEPLPNVDLEIDPTHWTEFLNDFSKDHQGAVATLEIVGPDIGDQESVNSLPFNGVSFESGYSEPAFVTFLLGTEPSDHVEHRIGGVTHIWHKPTGSEEVLLVEGEDDEKAILHLNVTPVLIGG